MNDALLVRFLEGRGQLDGVLEQFGFAHGALRQLARERDPGDVFHDEEIHVAVGFEAVQGSDIGMIQAGEGQCFFTETAAGGLVLHYIGGQELKRNFALQVLVVGAVHNSHATFANALEQAVVAEDAARNGLGGHTSFPLTATQKRTLADATAGV
jgi:hypothetical protein